MKKEPAKQEPSNHCERLGGFVLALVAAIGIFTAVYVAAGQHFLINQTAETNRLLSLFQRTDTVKEKENQDHPGWSDGVILPSGTIIVNNRCTNGSKSPSGSICINGCIEGFVPVDEACVKTIGKARELKYHEVRSASNLCQQWKNICKDGPVGPQCDVVCYRDDE